MRDGIDPDVRIVVDGRVRVGQLGDRGVESGRSDWDRGHGKGFAQPRLAAHRDRFECLFEYACPTATASQAAATTVLGVQVGGRPFWLEMVVSYLVFQNTWQR